MLIVVAPSSMRDLTHLGGELEFGTGRVHRRELDVVDVLLGVRDGRARLALDVLARGLQLVLDVDVRRRDERVDPRAGGVLDRVVGGVDVGHMGSRQPGDHRRHIESEVGPGDRLHGLEVAGRGDREARLDHVDAEPRQLRRDLQLLLRVERDPRRLLAVAQRRVEDQYSVWVVGLGHVAPHLSNFASPCWFRGYVRPPTRYSPRRGRRRSRRSRHSDMPPDRVSAAGSCALAKLEVRPAVTLPTSLFVEPSISPAYFSAIGLRRSFIVGVSSSPAGGQSRPRTLKRLICSTRVRCELARSTPAATSSSTAVRRTSPRSTGRRARARRRTPRTRPGRARSARRCTAGGRRSRSPGRSASCPDFSCCSMLAGDMFLPAALMISSFLRSMIRR